MKDVTVSGSSSIEEITGRVRDMEVTRHRFVGVNSQSGDNVIYFQLQDVPPQANLRDHGRIRAAGLCVGLVRRDAG